MWSLLMRCHRLAKLTGVCTSLTVKHTSNKYSANLKYLLYYFPVKCILFQNIFDNAQKLAVQILKPAALQVGYKIEIYCILYSN